MRVWKNQKEQMKRLSEQDEQVGEMKQKQMMKGGKQVSNKELAIGNLSAKETRRLVKHPSSAVNKTKTTFENYVHN